MIAFHGTADEYVPCDGGHGPTALAPIANHSVAYAMDFWRRTDGCTPIPQRATQGATVHDAYAGCTGGTAVELYTVQGGGHAWPAGRLARRPPTDPGDLGRPPEAGVFRRALAALTRAGRRGLSPGRPAVDETAPGLSPGRSADVRSQGGG